MKLIYQGKQDYVFSHRTWLDFPVHLHNALEVVFLTRGQTTVLAGSKPRVLQAGEVFVAFPNQVHSFENSRDIRGYVLIIPVNAYLAPYQNIMEQKLPEDPVIPKGQWEHTGLPQLLELAYRDRESASDQVMQGYFLTIVGKLLELLQLKEMPAGSPDVLQALLEYLNKNYTQPLTRKAVAKAVGCNESYISHVFSGTLKITLTDYITSLRIGDALHLLSETAMPVSQIALSLGFGSIRSFNRAFQKQMHRSPTEYRNTKKG